jgi:hypothetical protein
MNPAEVLTGAQTTMSADRVFGTPFEREGATILPVATVAGGGGGGEKGAGEGGVGFGVKARAAGIYVIKEGRATWRPAVNVNLVIAGGQLVALAGLMTLRAYLMRPRATDRSEARAA